MVDEVKEPTAPEGVETPEVVEPTEPVETPPETPTESLEEKATRLEEENEALAKERDRGGYKQRMLEDQVKANQLEMDALKRSEKAPAAKLFDGMDDSDPLTVREVREVMELERRNRQDEIIVQFDQQRQVISDSIAKSRHKDFDEVMEKYRDMVRGNPSLERIAYFDPDPAEYRYQKGLDHPDLKAKRSAKEKGTVVTTITKPRPRLPKGGGGGAAPGLTTLKQAADSSPEEWAAMSEEERVKHLQGG
ncbi:unnamed protein product [marine sediment metagenome]|uniref:Uncharacterized protein n=1 Tax=marine sediment metagenome TaxID=412755 RepID=X1HY33_9ZZZZ